MFIVLTHVFFFFLFFFCNSSCNSVFYISLSFSSSSLHVLVDFGINMVCLSLGFRLLMLFCVESSFLCMCLTSYAMVFFMRSWLQYFTCLLREGFFCFPSLKCYIISSSVIFSSCNSFDMCPQICLSPHEKRPPHVQCYLPFS